jgi:hypothetical protein
MAKVVIYCNGKLRVSRQVIDKQLTKFDDCSTSILSNGTIFDPGYNCKGMLKLWKDDCVKASACLIFAKSY